MNLKVYMLTCLVAAVITGLAYTDGYHKGWKEGRAALVAEQQEKAQAELAKLITRQLRLKVFQLQDYIRNILE